MRCKKTGRALNIAHRGFTRQFPDNTLEAFEAAIELGADGIEFDVQETADNEFIIHHDPQVSGADISGLTLPDIRDIRLENTYRIPTLEETLDLCRGKIILNVELKRVRSLECLLAVLRAGAGLEDIIISSFNQDLLLGLASLAADIRRGVLTALPVEDPVKITESTRTDLIIMRLPLASTELVDEIHAGNLSIFVWDCAGLTAVQNALKLDVEGIISDSPELVIQQQEAAS